MIVVLAKTPADIAFPCSAGTHVHYACVYLVMYVKRLKIASPRGDTAYM
jgi:hypothetical protein